MLCLLGARRCRRRTTQSSSSVPSFLSEAWCLSLAAMTTGKFSSFKQVVQAVLISAFSFISYRTGEYKLHYYETPTRMKFVMVTDTRVPNLRLYLHQIWANLYIEYVVKNPLSPIEHPGGVGVANELFEYALERFKVKSSITFLFHCKLTASRSHLLMHCRSDEADGL